MNHGFELRINFFGQKPLYGIVLWGNLIYRLKISLKKLKKNRFFQFLNALYEGAGKFNFDAMDNFQVKFVKASCVTGDMDGEFSFESIKNWVEEVTPVQSK